MACRNGIKSSPRSFAPTQREPATWGSQVKGLLTKTVANMTGRLRRKQIPSSAHVTRCTGSRGVGGMKAMNSPKANERVTLERLNVQHWRSSITAVKCFRHQCFSRRPRSGVMRFSQRLMFFFTSPEAPLCRFRDGRTGLVDYSVNQWFEASAKSTVSTDGGQV